jgi:3-oxoacyl-[acyl-carrier-protein] synthase II
MLDLEQVWITGIGLVSSLGEGAQDHWRILHERASCRPNVDEQRFAPYPVHPLTSVDFARQIPRKLDRRQMESWQRIGVYAAGLALEDARLAGNQELLDYTDLSVAAGNGERDLALDAHVLEVLGSSASPGAALNRELMSGLRPTLYLGQLSNLLAGNISIVHGVTGSSRTFKGEEMAGVSALANAVERIEEGESELILVGGAFNAEREDMLLGCELAHVLSSGPFRSVWERRNSGGGAVLGSIGAFLLIERAQHARSRGAVPYARIAAVRSARSRRAHGEAAVSMSHLFESLGIDPEDNGLALLSGASGVEPATAEEIAFVARLRGAGFDPIVRAWGGVLGHSMEAHFIVGMALAGLSVANREFYLPFADSPHEKPWETSPDRVLVTAVGSWRGEALGLVVSTQ